MGWAHTARLATRFSDETLVPSRMVGGQLPVSMMIACSAASPSVRAAGPGCRINYDLISCNAPHWTAAKRSNPGRFATFSGRTFCRTRSRQ